MSHFGTSLLAATTMTDYFSGGTCVHLKTMEDVLLITSRDTFGLSILQPCSLFSNRENYVAIPMEGEADDNVLCSLIERAMSL